MDLWPHKKRSGPEWWHTWETRGGTSWAEARATSLGHMQQRPTDAPIHNGVIRRTNNKKRGRGRPNLTWEESVMRDLNDWCITKELALDRREWKLAINVSETWSSVPSFYCLLSSFFSLSPFHFFDLAFYCLFSFFYLDFYRPLFFHYFSILFCTCFFTHVISSLAYPNLLGNKRLGCCYDGSLFFFLFYSSTCKLFMRYKLLNDIPQIFCRWKITDLGTLREA
jgi:hypothetical protein